MKTRNIAASCLTVVLGLLSAGTAAAGTTEAPGLSHQAQPGDSTTATVTVTSSDALAGESLTVLIMNDDADASDPATEDVVFIEQIELDDAGATGLQVQLPTEVLEDYDIALNTAAGTDRYLAPLAGEEESDDGSSQEPDDGSTADPDEEPTTVPDDGATSEPEDGATGGPDDGSTTDPDDGQGVDGTDGDGSGPGVVDGSQTDADGSQTGVGAEGADGADTADGSDAAGDQSSDGFLANTGANITFGVLIAFSAIAVGTLLVLRRRKAS